MTNAEARIRSFIERIIRLKEEQDAIGADIREVYKEAAGEGFNKTALGGVVTLVRKRAKDGEKLAALEADVALYLAAYDGSGQPVDKSPSKRHAHTYAPVIPHDSDGVVIEPAAPLPAEPRKSVATPEPEPVSTRPAAPSESVTTNTSAAIPGGAESRPSEPSPDAVPPAGASPSGQSGQALNPIPAPTPALVEMPDVPDFLRRTRAEVAA